MTVSSSISTHSYIPAGAMLAESLAGLVFINASDLVVTDPIGSAQVLGTDYEITGNGRTGSASIRTLRAYTAGLVLTITRRTPSVQVAAIEPNQPLPAEAVETELDRRALVEQEYRRDMLVLDSQVVKVSGDETGITLAPAATRDGKIPKFSGTGIEYVDPTALGDPGPIGPAGGLAAVRSYGAVDNPANSLVTVNAALAAQGSGGSVLVDAPISLTALPTNPGVAFKGEHPLKINTADGQGSRVLNRVGESPDEQFFGHNELFVFHNQIAKFLACSVIQVGDSQTAGYQGVIKQGRYASIPGVTCTNMAVGASTLDNFINNTGTVNGTGFHLAAVIAAAPKFIDIGYGGTNEPAFGRSLAQFDADLDTMLTAIRAVLPVRVCSINLNTANTQNDGANGRDETFVHQARMSLFRAALKYGCSFTNTLRLGTNASVDYGAGTNQNTMLDSARVHLQPTQAIRAAYGALDHIIPKGFPARAVLGEHPMVASSDIVFLASDGPSKWPKGGTLTARALPANGWPVDGFVTTEYHLEGSAPIQRCWSYNGPLRLCRHYEQGVGWRTWIADGLVDLTSTPAIAAAAALSAYPCGYTSTRAVPADGWPLDGYVYTHREPNQGNYGSQRIESYLADVPAQQRQWNSASGPGWGAWHALW